MNNCRVITALGPIPKLFLITSPTHKNNFGFGTKNRYKKDLLQQKVFFYLRKILDILGG